MIDKYASRPIVIKKPKRRKNLGKHSAHEILVDLLIKKDKQYFEGAIKEAKEIGKPGRPRGAK